VTTASKRRLQGSINWSFGTYWSGRADTLTTSVTFKMPPRFTLGFTTNQTFARLPEGRFVAKIFGSTIGFTPAPSIAWSNLVQYDNVSRNLGWQSRLRWTLQPGQDAFLVYSQGWIQDPLRENRFQAQDSKVSAKFQYAVRF
jgi:hypothetical protein